MRSPGRGLLSCNSCSGIPSPCPWLKAIMDGSASTSWLLDLEDPCQHAEEDKENELCLLSEPVGEK